MGRLQIIVNGELLVHVESESFIKVALSLYRYRFSIFTNIHASVSLLFFKNIQRNFEPYFMKLQFVKRS